MIMLFGIQDAMFNVGNDKFRDCTPHIEIACHFIWVKVVKGTIATTQVPSSN